MKIASLALAILIVGTSLLAVAPTAEAFGKCSSVVDDCSYLICIGYSHSAYNERCQYGIREPACLFSDRCPPYTPLP